MKTVFLAIGFASCLATAATAATTESFTATSKMQPQTVIMFPSQAGTPQVGGAHWQGVLSFKNRSGAITKANYECLGWMTNGETDQRSVCNATDEAKERFSMRIDCLRPHKGEPTRLLCTGFLQGISGRYAGRHGAFEMTSFNGEAAAEGAWVY
jgi:hypothetical protein